MSGHSNTGHKDHSRKRRLLIIAAAVVGMVCGTIGFYRYGAIVPNEACAPHASLEAPARFSRLLGSIYGALQLFLLDTPHLDRPVNVVLEIGRWSAALAFVLTAGFALAAVFKTEWRHARHFFSKGPRVVICGAGWRGLPLARDYLSRDGRSHSNAAVLVIEKDASSLGVAHSEKLGIPCIIGDATNPQVLARAGVADAAKLIVTCGDDGTNLEVAVRARELARERRRAKDHLVCYVHVANPDLRSLVRGERLLADAPGQFTAATSGIDIYENAARLLFQQYPLDRAGTHPIVDKSPEQVHLVILGFGEMGEAVLLQAARICHLANGHKLRVTVIDRDRALEADFCDRYPEIRSVCNLAFEAIDLHQPGLSKVVDELNTVERQLKTFVVCLPDDARNVTIAHRLSAIVKSSEEALEERSPLYVRLSSRHGLAKVFAEHESLATDQIAFFGMVEDVCNVQALEHPEIDRLARAIHEAYVEEQRRKGDSDDKNPALVSWDNLPSDMRESNRHAADHIETKVRAIGCHVVDIAAPGAAIQHLAANEIEILAKMEHSRFCAERFLGGWRLDPNPGNVKDLKARTSPTLVPWKNLPEREREKDREQVRRLPDILKLAGKKISR